MDACLHEKYTGTDPAEILDDLEKHSENGARIRIRISLIEGVNDSTKTV